jgi:hypothetical protein
MNQQINLHQPIFRKQRALFSAQIVLRICAIWALALGVIYVLSLWNEQALSRERERLQVARDEAAAALEQITASQAGQPGRSEALATELANLQNELAQKEAVLQLLSRGELGSTTGFAPQIDALAARRLAGVWLTHITLTEGGREISLQGEASEGSLLPQYLEHLAGSTGFPGARFGDVRLERQDGDTVAFELHSRAGKDLP